MKKKQFYKRIINSLRFFNKNIQIHPTADVSLKSTFEFSKNDYIKIGEKSIIKDFVKIETHYGFITIGKRSSVNSFCFLHGGKHPDSSDGGIIIGDDVRIGAHTVIVAINHITESIDKPISQQGWYSKGVVIDNDVWIGANVTILPGVRIGSGTVIAAGSVVTSDILDHHIIAGNPAKIIKDRRKLK